MGHQTPLMPTNAEVGTMSDRQTQLLARIQSISDPQSRLAWIIDRARKSPHLPPELRLEGYLVEGCLVRIWFIPRFDVGRCWFQADSDAASLKALCGLLCDYYNGETPQSIITNPPAFLGDLRLLRHLAESRRATVLRVADKIRAFAEKHSGLPAAE